MLDPQLLRDNMATVAQKLADRGYQLDVNAWQELEQRRKALQVETEHLQSQRTKISKSIGQAKAKGEDVQSLLHQVAQIGEQLESSKPALQQVFQDMEQVTLYTRKLAQDDVPVGQDEADNVEVRTWGTIPSFDFEVKDHIDLGAITGFMDA